MHKKISEIIVKDRKRPLRDISQLIESIKKSGLINPITINGNNQLIAGYNRLEACKFLGWEEIPVRILDIEGLQSELVEIDENLIRQNLTKLEEAEQLKRRKEIYEEIYPDGKSEEQRKKGLNVSSEIISSLEKVKTFTEDTAEKIGKSERSIQQDIQIANIPDEIKAEIKGSEMEDKKTDLLELARIKDPEKQREIVQKVKSGRFKNVKATFNRPSQSTYRKISNEDYEKLIKPKFDLEEKLRSRDARIKSLENQIERYKQTIESKIIETDEIPAEIKVDLEKRIITEKKLYFLPPEFEIKEQSKEQLLLVARNYTKNYKNY